MHLEFRLNYNSSKLNTWEMLPLELAGVVKSEKPLSVNKELLSNQETSSQTAKLKDVKKQIDSSENLKIKKKEASTSKNTVSSPASSQGKRDTLKHAFVFCNSYFYLFIYLFFLCIYH